MSEEILWESQTTNTQLRLREVQKNSIYLFQIVDVDEDGKPNSPSGYNVHKPELEALGRLAVVLEPFKRFILSSSNQSPEAEV